MKDSSSGSLEVQKLAIEILQPYLKILYSFDLISFGNKKPIGKYWISINDK